MLCEGCNNSTASVHLIKILNGIKTEKHLCEKCALTFGESCFVGGIHFSVNDLVKAMFSQQIDGTSMPELSCPNCGMFFADFSNSGKIGCNVCYEIFHEQLEPILRRVHGISNHIGKVPRRTGKAIRLRLEVKKLRNDLESCVEREDYECAAQIRDSIRALEIQLNSEGVEFYGK